jgi:hypothetical protein
LKNVFITLYRDVSKDPILTTPNNNYGGATTMFKECNLFYHPAKGGNDSKNRFYEFAQEPEAIVSIGSKLFPEYPIRSNAEFYYNLTKALDIHNGSANTVHILPRQYRYNKFIIGISTEKVTESSFTGISTKNNELIRIDFRQLGTTDDNVAQEMFVALHADYILSIRDTGVELFD